MAIASAREINFGRSILCIGLLVAFSLPATIHAQSGKNTDAAKADAAKGAVKQAQSASFPLQAAATTEDVQQNVSVEAVLIPPKIANKIFGREIGQNYAVIALTISNRSTDASLIVNSLFIDYSGWLLSGYSQTVSANDPCTAQPASGEQKENAANPASGSQSSNPPAQAPRNRNALGPWQSQTCPAQIASTEYRMVRGELLDAQTWTVRNLIIRSLVAVGSIASAYTFTTSRIATVQGIGAFNGQVIPAAQLFWPDPVVGQLNNISDLAFRVNKVIERQGSDIVVAFYPIDRFLTPGLRKVFLSSPAIFFSPDAMIVDPVARRKMEPFINPLLNGATLESMAHSLPAIAGGACSQKASDSSLREACDLHDLLNRVSLNTVRVIVGGSMTVDVDSVPAKIDSVDMDTPGSGTLAAALAKAGEVEGVIQGSFLTGGQPSIVEAAQDGITNVSAVKDGSTDSQLHFKMTLSKPLPTDAKKLTFAVTKTDKQNRSVPSATKEYMLPSIPEAPATPSPAPEKPAAEPAAPAGTAKPGP